MYSRKGFSAVCLLPRKLVVGVGHDAGVQAATRWFCTTKAVEEALMRDCNVHRMSVLASEEVLRRCEQRDILKVLKKGRMK